MNNANGTVWTNSCIGCGKVKETHGDEMPGQCPSCGGARWLCHLINQDGSKQGGIIAPSSPERVIPPLSILSTLNQYDDKGKGSNLEDTYTPVNGPGRKKTELPDDLIRELASQGYGAIRIAEILLDQQGLVISYRTILRRLQAQLL